MNTATILLLLLESSGETYPSRIQFAAAGYFPPGANAVTSFPPGFRAVDDFAPGFRAIEGDDEETP